MFASILAGVVIAVVGLMLRVGLRPLGLAIRAAIGMVVALLRGLIWFASIIARGCGALYYRART